MIRRSFDDGAMTPDEDGEWVAYAEVEQELTTLRQTVEQQKAEIAGLIEGNKSAFNMGALSAYMSAGDVCEQKVEYDLSYDWNECALQCEAKIRNLTPADAREKLRELMIRGICLSRIMREKKPEDIADEVLK